MTGKDSIDLFEIASAAAEGSDGEQSEIYECQKNIEERNELLQEFKWICYDIKRQTNSIDSDDSISETTGIPAIHFRIPTSQCIMS